MAKLIIDISDNATCGEVIEALFPDFEFREKHGVYSNYFNDIRVKQELWDVSYDDTKIYVLKGAQNERRKAKTL